MPYFISALVIGSVVYRGPTIAQSWQSKCVDYATSLTFQLSNRTGLGPFHGAEQEAEAAGCGYVNASGNCWMTPESAPPISPDDCRRDVSTLNGTIDTLTLTLTQHDEPSSSALSNQSTKEHNNRYVNKTGSQISTWPWCSQSLSVFMLYPSLTTQNADDCVGKLTRSVVGNNVLTANSINWAPFNVERYRRRRRRRCRRRFSSLRRALPTSRPDPTRRAANGPIAGD